MKFARQRLMEILKNRPGATAADLSRALQVTQADIRHHLSNLEKEGLIVTTGKHHSGRRGRPARRYSLSASAQKDNFDLLSSALLNTSLENLSSGERTAFLKRVAHQVVTKKTNQGPLSQRLVQTVNQLNELGYQARWEAHAEAPRVIFEHCPFAILRPKHPELCQLDMSILEVLLRESITCSESNAHLADGICIFLVGKISPPSSSS
jgi:predicted ArsR family transcriptional regulator